jgi:hypothetical protein
MTVLRTPDEDRQRGAAGRESRSRDATASTAALAAESAGPAAPDQRLSWNLVVGMAVVLLGVWIAERNPDERRAAASNTAASSEDGEVQVREPIR